MSGAARLKPMPDPAEFGSSEEAIRVIPHAIGPEKSVLSTMLKEPETKIAAALSEGLTVDHFHIPAHRILFREIVDRHNAGMVVELVSFVDGLNKRGLLDSVGGPANITDVFTYAPNAQYFALHAAELRRDFDRRTTISACQRAIDAAYDYSDSSAWRDALDELRSIDANASAGERTLLQRAYALRFDPECEPPPDEVCLAIGDVPIAARGNLTVIQGKSKVGKSAVVSAVLGTAYRGTFAASGDTLSMSWVGTDGGAILHLDTEQSRADWHTLVARGIVRSGLPPRE